MSLIALAFTMCTPLICETYLIDKSYDETMTECNTQYVDHSMEFTLARQQNSLQDWADQFNIPDVDKAISHAFDCVVIQEEELP